MSFKKPRQPKCKYSRQNVDAIATVKDGFVDFANCSFQLLEQMNWKENLYCWWLPSVFCHTIFIMAVIRCYEISLNANSLLHYTVSITTLFKKKTISLLRRLLATYLLVLINRFHVTLKVIYSTLFLSSIISLNVEPTAFVILTWGQYC